MPVTDFRAGGDTQGVDLYWVAETNWGQVPAGPPKLNTARITGHSLTADKTTVQSQEIVGDAQIADRVRTGFAAGGAVNFEFSLDTPGGSAGHLVDLLEGAMWGSWGTELGISGTIDASATDDSFNDNAAAGTMFANVQIGQWIRAKGFTQGGNEGAHQVTAKPNNDKIIVASTLTTESGNGNETIAGQMMRNAKVGHSYVFEHRQSDVGPEILMAYLGQMIDVWEMTFPPEDIITGSFTFAGKERLAAAAVSVGDGSPNPRSTVGVSETSFQMPSIRRNGAVLAGIPRQITMNVNRGLRRQGGVGLQGAAQGMGLGTHDITGTVEAYLADKSLIDAHDQHTWAQMDWRVQNAAGDALVFTLPQVVLASGGPSIPGRDQDVIETYNWESRKDPTWGHALQLDFLPA